MWCGCKSNKVHKKLKIQTPQSIRPYATAGNKTNTAAYVIAVTVPISPCIVTLVNSWMLREHLTITGKDKLLKLFERIRASRSWPSFHTEV